MIQVPQSAFFLIREEVLPEAPAAFAGRAWAVGWVKSGKQRNINISRKNKENFRERCDIAVCLIIDTPFIHEMAVCRSEMFLRNILCTKYLLYKKSTIAGGIIQ